MKFLTTTYKYFPGALYNSDGMLDLKFYLILALNLTNVPSTDNVSVAVIRPRLCKSPIAPPASPHRKCIIPQPLFFSVFLLPALHLIDQDWVSVITGNLGKLKAFNARPESEWIKTHLALFGCFSRVASFFLVNFLPSWSCNLSVILFRRCVH